MCWFYTCYFTFHCHIWCRPVSFNLNERLFGFFVSIIAPIHSASHGMSSKWGDFLFPSKEYLIISFRFLKTLYFIPFTDRMKSKLINVVYTMAFICWILLIFSPALKGIIDKNCICLRCTAGWFHINTHCEMVSMIKPVSIHCLT